MSSQYYNPFKYLNQEESLPPEHKASVMKTLEMIKFMADVTDMFSIKQAKVDSDLLSNLIESKKKAKEKK